ncbi:hypothetical protein [Limnoglobus roseus]|uniref:Transcriptional regulator NrdR n=1 Tax=Limnoglobus roseus TaxID=2598579 RepID=A0A5C1AD14_9BACT|nr:hypothetical protein [Limnoglobus roseus]QEL14948.1 hypothetical protein PX52LOC_01850 [Limnoglobus roseus]
MPRTAGREPIILDGLLCPKCHHYRIPARSTHRKGRETQRTRVCRRCGHAFRTSEVIGGVPGMKVK